MSLRPFFGKSVNLSKAAMLVSIALMVAAGWYVPAAKADPITINVSPIGAPVGATITISGINATAGAEVRIYLWVVFLTTTIANETGGYLVNVAVPAINSGTYPIMASDTVEGDAASTMFTVEPRVILSPLQGGYNHEISIRGDGFASFSDITIDFDGIDVTPFPAPQTDPLGSFESSFFVISRPNGTYTVTAYDTGANSASAEFTVVPRILTPWLGTSGAPSSLAFIEGYGFSSSVNVTVHFGSVDVTPYPWMLTNMDGSFQVPFFVPDVPDGFYTINASDADGNMAFLQFVVPSPILTLTPSRTFESSLVTARGIGFMTNSRILLYLEDVTMTHLIDLMWMTPNLLVNDDGSFEYSFIVPVTKPGIYSVAAYQMLSSPTDLRLVASAPLTILDSSPLDVEVNVGSLHFRGEMAEFYVKTAFGGDLVNGKISGARLYYSGGNASLDLSSSIEFVSTGLHRIPYAVPINASQGTYTLVVEAYYYATAVEAYGTASDSFVVSPTLTNANAQLIDINDNIGTVVIPDLGIIKVNLTAVNARLVSVQGTEATIQSDIGELKTTTDAIHAKVTSVDGNVETVSSDLGSVQSYVTTTQFQMETAILIVALVSAAGSMLSLILVRKSKPPAPPSPSNPEPSRPDPPKSHIAMQTAPSAEMADLTKPTEQTPAKESSDAAESSTKTETSEAPE